MLERFLNSDDVVTAEVLWLNVISEEKKCSRKRKQSLRQCLSFCQWRGEKDEGNKVRGRVIRILEFSANNLRQSSRTSPKAQWCRCHSSYGLRGDHALTYLWAWWSYLKVYSLFIPRDPGYMLAPTECLLGGWKWEGQRDKGVSVRKENKQRINFAFGVFENINSNKVPRKELVYKGLRKSRW